MHHNKRRHHGGFVVINYDSKNKIFHLQTQKASYVMHIDSGYLLHLYWGKKINRYRGSRPLTEMPRSFAPYADPARRGFTLSTLPLEYPAYGNGDYRHPAYQIQLENGSTITDLRYAGHVIYSGKKKLNGLPATYIEQEQEAQSLDIMLQDPVAGLSVVLTYSVFRDFNAITRSVRFENIGAGVLRILNAVSASIDFRDDEYDSLSFYGSHNNERNMDRRPLAPGSRVIESVRGASSPQHDPFFALMRQNADEAKGEVFGFSFVYSGNFRSQIEVDQYKTTRASIGLNLFDFSWRLDPDDTFQTPEAVLVYSDQGLGGMSRTYHHLYRERLARGKYRDQLRPILINNWEATYFKLNEKKLLAIAKEAQKVNIELFVLDDGWFGHRDNDKSSLGDWFVDKRKLPHGLAWLSNRIHEMGLQFGLWFEPEMVSPDSDLYRAHPDWCLHVPNRLRSLSRYQFVLDLSRKDVRDYLEHSLSSILSNANINYVKWDMNRHMTEIGSALLPHDRQRETAHRYMLGLYELIERLTNAFPNILFESCSSGGGRFDPGMLYYMPQTWTSDNTDAICRLKIQYGTSAVYPPIAMGAHVSAVPNHQVGRITSLAMRGAVAMSGNFGYELDLTKLTDEEKDAVKKQVAFYKEIRPLIQFGDFYRITSPFERGDAAWCFVSPDQSEAIGFYFTVLASPSQVQKSFRFQGLNSEFLYENNETGHVYGGDELMNTGLNVPIEKGDFRSYVWRFRKVVE
ncbi:alpha-galactosidase [Sporolactobacillus sp. STSJ-5]|uniref:alpha-galactosidase n=1 Tax=Sporolactobacillus sp. STSJ-5 TaxID=2965076 RepID=UPI0021043DC2|nr:alpha-galactosidase [Sporolactobacillus sp. STSJ-5]MCQ2009885.1 alpha-galactosidase [Sporolactobacillus sp. STSJ-5]